MEPLDENGLDYGIILSHERSFLSQDEFLERGYLAKFPLLLESKTDFGGFGVSTECAKKGNDPPRISHINEPSCGIRSRKYDSSLSAGEGHARKFVYVRSKQDRLGFS
jgi:hypothetical protein